MTSYKKNLILPALLVSLGAAISQQAQAWVHQDSSYKVCNTFNYSLQITKVYGYQMNTNNDHSANQIVDAHSCVNIDFWGQWQSNGYDLDDELKFSVRSNDSEVGKFTIYVNSYLDGLTFSIKNNSDFIKQKYSPTRNSSGLLSFE